MIRLLSSVVHLGEDIEAGAAGRAGGQLGWPVYQKSTTVGASRCSAVVSAGDQSLNTAMSHGIKYSHTCCLYNDTTNSLQISCVGAVESPAA